MVSQDVRHYGFLPHRSRIFVCVCSYGLTSLLYRKLCVWSKRAKAMYPGTWTSETRGIKKGFDPQATKSCRQSLEWAWLPGREYHSRDPPHTCKGGTWGCSRPYRARNHSKHYLCFLCWSHTGCLKKRITRLITMRSKPDFVEFVLL